MHFVIVYTKMDGMVVLLDENKLLWDKCVEFHGHSCGGLTIGYKAALYLIELFDLSLGGGGNAGCLSKDEEIVCIAENDACSIDAISVILGCSVGKGNLLFHMRGKQAYTFYDRKTNRSVRLVMKPLPLGMTKADSFDYLQNKAPSEIFEVKETKLMLPEKARMFSSYACEICGEVAGSNWIRIMDGKKVCLDCYEEYDRFHV